MRMLPAHLDILSVLNCLKFRAPPLYLDSEDFALNPLRGIKRMRNQIKETASKGYGRGPLLQGGTEG